MNLLIALAFLLASHLCPAETHALDLSSSFGGENRLFLEAQLPESGNNSHELGFTGARAESTGRLSIDSAYASFSAELFAGINRDGGIPALRLDEFMATLYPAENLVLRLGRFRFDDTQAIILPSADFMSPQIPEALLSGSPRTSLPEDLIQANFLLGPLSIRGTLGLTVPPSVVPEQDSPWFPFGMFPETLTSSLLSTTFTRTSIIVQESTIDSFTWEPAFLLALQYEGRNISTKVIAFHGLERAEVWQGMLFFPNGPFSTIFELQLMPHRELVTAFGGSLVYTNDNWRWFAEGSYTLGRSADSRELDESDTEDMNKWNFRLHSIDELTGSAGLLWSSVNLPLRVAAELKWSHWYGTLDSTIAPGMGKAAALAINWLALPYLNMDILYLRSMIDASAALTTRLRLAFGNDHEAMLMIPWLMGEPDTELGRYDNGLHGVVVLIIRY